MPQNKINLSKEDIINILYSAEIALASVGNCIVTDSVEATVENN